MNEFLRKSAAAIRENLERELKTPYEVSFDLGISVALAEYCKRQRRVDDINLELKALNDFEDHITKTEQKAELEKQAQEAAKAERQRQAAELFEKMSGTEFGPEYSVMLAELALLTK